jgi:hypothetical protein
MKLGNFRFITLVGWLLSVLSLFYGALIGVWIIGLTFGEKTFSEVPQDYNIEFARQLLLMFLPFYLPLVFLVICVRMLWLCRKRSWDMTGRLRTAILFLLVAILGVMSIDSPPIKNDYTAADILIKGRDVEASYQTLMKYFKKGSPIKVDSPYMICKSEWVIETNITAFSEGIEKTWNDNADARAVMDKLAKYDVIADFAPGVPLDTNIPILSFVALRNLVHTYRFHCLIKTENGESVEAARQLAEFHSVVLKAYKNCSLLVNKMCFGGVAGCDIETAYQIIQHPKCTPEAVKILANAFPSIPGKDVSLRSPIICEYLGLRNICATWPAGEFMEVFRSPCKPPSFIRRNLSRILFPLIFKRNTTINMLKLCYDPVITGASQSPMKIPDIQSLIEEHFSRPRLNNLGGWVLIQIAIPSFSRAANSASRTKVLSDLLAIELHKRLGEPIDIPDFYSGKPYFVDEKTGKLTSVGPDGIAGTKDDIQLGQSF